MSEGNKRLFLACTNPKLFSFLLLILVTLSSTIWQASGTNTEKTNNQDIQNISSSLQYKLKPPATGMYQGAYTDFGGSENKVSGDRILEFEKMIGKKIVWATFSNNWGEEGIVFPLQKVKIISDLGVVPFVRLMPRTNFQEGVVDPAFKLQDIIDGKFDDSLRKWAVAARTISVPIMVEFGTEVNGDWFPWSGIYNGGGKTDEYGDPNFPDGPERFKDAYKHIINLFREEDANKITWCFHVFPPREISENEDLKKSWNDIKNYYPGDDYIDWVGVSVYGKVEPDSDWKSFGDIMNKSYPVISRITENKPLAIFEWATAEAEDQKEGNKTSWIENSLQLLQDGRYPRIKAISYWDEKWNDDSGTAIDLRINSSPSTALAYKQAMSSPFFRSQAEFY